MAKNTFHPTSSPHLGLVTVYKQDGHYFVGQRLLHSEFGLGTVTQVRRSKIHVVMDDDPTQPGGKKKERRFPSGVLTLQERMVANNFSHDDLDLLFAMDEEDFDEHFRIRAHDADMENPSDVA